MNECRFGVSPVNYPDPDPDLTWDVGGGDIVSWVRVSALARVTRHG